MCQYLCFKDKNLNQQDYTWYLVVNFDTWDNALPHASNEQVEHIAAVLAVQYKPTLWTVAIMESLKDPGSTYKDLAQGFLHVL